MNPPYYKNWWYSVAVLGGRCELNLKVLPRYQLSLKTINCSLVRKLQYNKILYLNFWFGFHKFKRKYFPSKTRQNKSPQKKFCLSSKM